MSPTGEWLPCGQGEDVVSGKSDALAPADMAKLMSEAHATLLDAPTRLEIDGRDVQDIEFTGKRVPVAFAGPASQAFFSGSGPTGRVAGPGQSGPGRGAAARATEMT